MSRFIMIFVDGVGIGENDPSRNPFVALEFKTFQDLFGAVPTKENPVLINEGKYIFPSDACLGVAGLPQSGTGQTSIFCGVNAPRLIGKHFGPYPYSSLVSVIKEKNIFNDFILRGQKPYFINAYPSVFFDYIRSGKQRLSVTTLSCRLAGMRLNDVTDVISGKALTAEITNERWNSKLGYNLDVITPEAAARRLLGISGNYDFTVFEYFLTDHLGHGRYEESIETTLRSLDIFLYTIISELPPETDLLICSDHGNIEDLSVKTHTYNSALTISAGKNAEILFREIKDLTNIKPAILELTE